MTDNAETGGGKQIPLSPDDKRTRPFSITADGTGKKEAALLGRGESAEELTLVACAAEAERTEKFRDHFEFLALASLYVVWSLMLIIGLVWIYHLIAPPIWWRLPDQQVSNIHSIVTGGIIAGIASGHMKRRLSD